MGVQVMQTATGLIRLRSALDGESLSPVLQAIEPGEDHGFRPGGRRAGGRNTLGCPRQ